MLFLDELPEFKRNVLEVMRQPLEDREVTISRARFTITYPSNFMLVASMNPSPGGYFNDGQQNFQHTATEMQRYLNRISGLLLDRIDIHMEVCPVPFEELSSKGRGESIKDIRQRVIRARELQEIRFAKELGTHCNAQMDVRQIRTYCPLDKKGKALLGTAMKQLKLSASAYNRINKVARGIADLESQREIEEKHLAEAIQYRSLDREGWLG